MISKEKILAIFGAVCVLAILLGLVFHEDVSSFGATVIQPRQGGTGTGSSPSTGQVLVGQSDGSYSPQATSTLGITGGVGSESDPIFMAASTSLAYLTSFATLLNATNVWTGISNTFTDIILGAANTITWSGGSGVRTTSTPWKLNNGGIEVGDGTYWNKVSTENTWEIDFWGCVNSSYENSFFKNITNTGTWNQDTNIDADHPGVCYMADHTNSNAGAFFYIGHTNFANKLLLAWNETVVDAGTTTDYSNLHTVTYENSCNWSDAQRIKKLPFENTVFEKSEKMQLILSLRNDNS